MFKPIDEVELQKRFDALPDEDTHALMVVDHGATPPVIIGFRGFEHEPDMDEKMSFMKELLMEHAEELPEKSAMVIQFLVATRREDDELDHDPDYVGIGTALEMVKSRGRTLN